MNIFKRHRAISSRRAAKREGESADYERFSDYSYTHCSVPFKNIHLTQDPVCPLMLLSSSISPITLIRQISEINPNKFTRIQLQVTLHSFVASSTMYKQYPTTVITSQIQFTVSSATDSWFDRIKASLMIAVSFIMTFRLRINSTTYAIYSRTLAIVIQKMHIFITFTES